VAADLRVLWLGIDKDRDSTLQRERFDLIASSGVTVPFR
jgi:hypothetical protein